MRPTLVNPSSFGTEPESSNLGEFLEDKGASDFVIMTWDEDVGAVVQRLGKSDIYLIPDRLDSDNATVESMVVLSHELGHIRYNHHIKISLFSYVLFYLIGMIVYLFPDYSILVSIAGFFVLTSSINYVKHIFEYKADSFAAKSVSESAVQDRIRKVGSSDNSGVNIGLPYAKSHPETIDRLEKIENQREKPSCITRKK